MLFSEILFAMSNVLVGILSDIIDTRIGRKTPWYIIGTIIIIPSFTAMMINPGFTIGSRTQSIYFFTLAMLFGIGKDNIKC
jgi:Na+/melibiose symporter-like transporter